MSQAAFFALGLLAGGVGTWARWASRPLHRRMRRQVMVTLKSGTAFRGVFAAGDRHVLVLNNSELIEGEGRVPVDGEVILPWGDVRYVQRF